MDLDREFVQRIVSDVMAQIATRPADVVSTTSVTSPGVSKPLSATFDDKVVTAELLEQKARGLKEIQIAASAVLTPSARDFLAHHDIRFTRQTDSSNSETNGAHWRAILVQSTPAVINALDDLKRTSGIKVSQESAVDTSDAVERAASVLCRAEAHGVLVLADASQAIACLANRFKKVRAAVIDNAAMATTAKQQLSANLYCVSPSGKSFIELRNLLRQATRGGIPQPPAGWQN